MLKYRIVYLLFFIALIFPDKSPAQAFGFGCFGFVGGYGGYSLQKYEPLGLNEHIRSFNSFHGDSLSEPLSEFGTAKGYRVGVNLFRANLSGLILTVKGFYQSLLEKKSAQITSAANGNSSAEYQMELKGWGAGIDLGTTITGALTWKVIDAAVLFNSASLKITTNLPGGNTVLLTYSTPKTSIGYSVGTGFIYEIIEDYISLEGFAGYSVFKIDYVQSADGTILSEKINSSEPVKDFISNGGFNAVIQLNIGFPF